MNCPVCTRSLAPTLSICPTCGAMMNDTVREELQTKIVPGTAVRERSAAAPAVAVQQPRIAASVPTPAAVPRRVETAELRVSKTSPTLVEFQHNNTAIPDWRLKLQNAVQQRKVGAPASQIAVAPVASMRKAKPEPAAVGLDAEIVNSDPRVAAAMKRIADSRKTFASPATIARKTVPQKPAAPVSNASFGVVARKPFHAAAPAAAAAFAPARTISEPVATVPRPVPRPVLVETERPVVKRETNKLPRIEMPSGELKIDADRVLKPEPKPGLEVQPRETPAIEVKRIHIPVEMSEEADYLPQVETDEIEDLAPLSMRFGSGLFDLIIGLFASMLVLSPIAFSGHNWLTTSGVLTIMATAAVLLFLYSTISVGFFGKTIGMRLFGLELVDALENDYPTMRQAAVNSCLFVFSLIFAGAGFVTMYFNEEKRAVHDLLSGTILVREF